MNVDLSIYRMASRETEYLSVAQLIVAKKRQELELKIAREQVVGSGAATSASVDAALRDMQRDGELAHPGPPPDLTGIVIDKTA